MDMNMNKSCLQRTYWFVGRIYLVNQIKGMDRSTFVLEQSVIVLGECQTQKSRLFYLQLELKIILEIISQK